MEYLNGWLSPEGKFYPCEVRSDRMSNEFGYFHIDDKDIFGKDVTAVPVKKYMVISVSDNCVHNLDSIKLLKEYNPFDIGMNIFYTYNFETFCYRRIDFSSYESHCKLVFRLLGKDKDNRIYFRVLRCNEYDNIDFIEELKQVSSLIMPM